MQIWFTNLTVKWDFLYSSYLNNIQIKSEFIEI